MRARVLRLLRFLVWKLSKHDYLLLHPAWSVTSGEGYKLISTGPSPTRYLPMRYNYHTREDWELRYEIRGHSSGVLWYKLRVPQEPPFLAVKLSVQLPFTLTVKRVGQEMLGNRTVIPVSKGRALPTEASWLVGEFEFHSQETGTMRRRAGHRIRLEKGENDAKYFSGGVYNSYDDNAAWMPNYVLKAIEPYHPLTGKLLDVGCATGLLVAHALSKGLDAEGIDSSEWAVGKANLRTGGRCRRLDLDTAEASTFSSSYDIITMHSVLEHLSDPSRALELLFKLCRPGGVVYIQTLNADSLMHRVMGEDWGGYSDYTHRSSWITADWLIEAAKASRFEIAFARRYYVWNDNIYDDVWSSFVAFAQVYPANVILEDHFGDAVEVILRRPYQL
ncbi:MAG TPA: class I SAM-dependent methyltransferase [Chloroflexia bacterium]|nr:class I SAM-dependent methyltransferase [Chloroflexia bacterium]